MNPVEAAIKFDVGEATINTWIQLGVINSIKIGNLVYIPENTVNPMERMTDEKSISNNRISDISCVANMG